MSSGRKTYTGNVNSHDQQCLIPRFDPSLGTLVEVDILATLRAGGILETGWCPPGTTLGAGGFVTLNLSLPGGDTTPELCGSVIPLTAFVVAFLGQPVVPLTAFKVGPPAQPAVPISASVNVSAVLTATNFGSLSPFIGSEDLPLQVGGELSAAYGLQQLTFDVGFGADVTITYVYQ